MAKIVPWDVPIRATWARANELDECRNDGDRVTLKLAEEDSPRVFRLSFGRVEAFRETSEHDSFDLEYELPDDGGFFEMLDSPWIKKLGSSKVGSLNDLHHFIVCCYDEVIEVVARDYTIEQIEGPKFPFEEES